MVSGIFPGSFDPFTIGHLDVIKRSCRLFDTLYVAVLENVAKIPAFSAHERVETIERALQAEDIKNARTIAFSGMTVDCAKALNSSYIIRGLRSALDYDYESGIEAVNKLLNPEINTIYIGSDPAISCISSSVVKEICSFGGSAEGLVPDINLNMIMGRLCKDGRRQ